MKHIRSYSSILMVIACGALLMHCTHKAPVTTAAVMPISTDTMSYISTFQIASCNKVTLQYYSKMSDAGKGILPKEAVITDDKTIEQILSWMKQLPDEGDKMVKMGDVAVLNVFLSDGTSRTYVTYYLNHVKTPATSFYSTPPKEEKLLYDVLMSYIPK